MNGWLGESQGMQISRDAAAKKLVAPRPDHRPRRTCNHPTTELGIPTITGPQMNRLRTAAISVNNSGRLPPHQKIFSASLQLIHRTRLPSIRPHKGVRLMLEVIDKGCTSETHPVPLLFIHGARHAAWCWDEHFLDFFADKRYRALAVSLRGHGASTTPKPLRKCSIAAMSRMSVRLLTA